MNTKYLILPLILTLLSGCAGGIVVGGAATGAATVHDRRTVGTVIDDQVLSWDISHALYSESELEELGHINVTVYNNTVLLSGEVPSEDLKLRANAITSGVAKDKQIFNELAIRSKSSLLARSKDTYTTAKVKTALLDIDLPDFDPTRIKVTTEADVVYLMGLVTKQEADKTTERIRTVSGVSKVVRLFEYFEK